MPRYSKRSLNPSQRNRVLALLRAEGIKPPKVGYCVRALGGEICRHPASPHLPNDTGYQAIEIDVDLSKPAAAEESSMRLHPPFIITSRLLPGVQISDGTISIEYSDRPGKQGRDRYKYYIDAPGIEYENDDLQSGGGGGSLQRGMGDLLTFLGAAAESYSYRMRSKRDEPGESEDLFPPEVVKWAATNDDEISMIGMEIEESDKDLIEE